MVWSANQSPVSPEVPIPTWRVPKWMVDELRDFLQDHARLNDVIKGQEHTDEQLAKMIVQAVLTFNATPPVAEELRIRDLDRMFQEQWILILDVAAARALMSVINRLQRNHITYQDKDINKQINERWQYYERTITRLLGGQSGTDGATTRIKEFKLFMNSDNCMGTNMTELARFTRPFLNYIDVVI